MGPFSFKKFPFYVQKVRKAYIIIYYNQKNTLKNLLKRTQNMYSPTFNLIVKIHDLICEFVLHKIFLNYYY